MKKKMYKILIVDDAAVTLRNIKNILDKKYEVSLATSGQQALKTISEQEPDLVLLDYEMPGMTGKEVFETMQADENMKNIPVIFLTGVSDRKKIQSVLKSKPAGYILKPADEEKLVDTVKQVLASLEASRNSEE